MADTYDILRRVVSEVRCKPGWTFRIAEDEGALRLVITVEGVDSYPPHRPFDVSHWHAVPPTTYNEKSWKRWVFEQWGEDRPFAPLHGPGEDPYTVHEYRDEVDARTTQDGSVRTGRPT
jgi:hypothetical protein